jgi:hypothetical protein
MRWTCAGLILNIICSGMMAAEPAPKWEIPKLQVSSAFAPWASDIPPMLMTPDTTRIPAKHILFTWATYRCDPAKAEPDATLWEIRQRLVPEDRLTTITIDMRAPVISDGPTAPQIGTLMTCGLTKTNDGFYQFNLLIESSDYEAKLVNTPDKTPDWATHWNIHRSGKSTLDNCFRIPSGTWVSLLDKNVCQMLRIDLSAREK